MCGITGIHVFSEAHKGQLNCVHAASEQLKKRGPDDQGVFIHELTALAHRRLSIIDTSKAGAQPFTDASGRYTIVLNGEIFNYREHRKSLIAAGYCFRSESDTEVLLHLWIQKKEKCLNELNGFFAFAVYDKAEQSLVIVRDRYGVKPLFYVIDQDRLIFASEMKAMLEYPISRELDRTSVFTFFQLNYIPAPDSIFKSVKKLMPGHFLTLRDRKTEITCYYQLPAEPAVLPPSYSTAQDKLRELLDQSVQARMIADVPLGAFLSGGVDSSVVTALASRHTLHLKTFSIGFPDNPFFDETPYALQVAKKFKTDHTVFSVNQDMLFAHLEEALDYLDEPFADSSALLVYMLSALTRKEVTVALTGDGADELFSGYHKHGAEHRIRNKGLAEGFIGAAGPLWSSLPKSRNSRVGNKIRQFRKFSKGMKLSNQERYWLWASIASEEEAGSLLISQEDRQVYSRRKKEVLAEIGPGFNSVLRTDFSLVLQNDMLVKTDRMSMAHGLELRNPFLDHRLVDFVFSLPESYKISEKNRKRILKDAYAEVLPAEILNRKKKGFEVPLLTWFRTGLKSMIFDDLLRNDFIRAQGIFNPDEIDKLKTKLFSSNPEDAVARIWGLIVFQYWYKKYDLK